MCITIDEQLKLIKERTETLQQEFHIIHKHKAFQLHTKEIIIAEIFDMVSEVQRLPHTYNPILALRKVRCKWELQKLFLDIFTK